MLGLAPAPHQTHPPTLLLPLLPLPCNLDRKGVCRASVCMWRVDCVLMGVHGFIEVCEKGCLSFEQVSQGLEQGRSVRRQLDETLPTPLPSVWSFPQSHGPFSLRLAVQQALA